MLIFLRTWLTRALLLAPLLLVACGGSSDGGPAADPGDEPPPSNGNGEDPGDDNGPGDDDNGNGNGGDHGAYDPEPSGPEQSFDPAPYLPYNEYYDGESEWAEIDGNAEDPVQMADVAQLGNALMVLPYFVATEVLIEEAGVPEDLLEFMDLRACGSDEEKRPNTPAASAAGCLRAANADNVEIDYSGSINWDSGDTDLLDLVISLEGFELDWRGETFSLDGSVGLQEDASFIFLAFDVTHLETEESYRYWIRHAYGISTSNPAINSIVFHPQQGAAALLAESAFARSGSCEGGGFESESGVIVDGGSGADATAELYFTNMACDVFGFSLSASVDSHGEQVRQAIYPSFASLGMDFGVEVTPRTADTVHQLGINAEDEYLEPELVDIAVMGHEREGDDWTRYEIALTYDMADLPQQLLDNGVLKALWSAYNPSVSEELVITMDQAALSEWGEEPAASDYLGAESQQLPVSTGLGGASDKPWWSFPATEMLELSIDEGRSHLNVVLQLDLTGTVLGPPDEEDNIIKLCAEQTGDCEEYDLPTLHLAYPVR